MREMTWSWGQLQEAPADLIEELVHRISAERTMTEEKRKRDSGKPRQSAAAGKKGRAR